MCFSFSTFFSVSRHIHGPTVCVSHFPGFLTFHAIFQVLQCTFIFFHVFQCFPPYSKSYHVRFSFSSFVCFFCHITGPTVWVSNFSCFLRFLAIFQVLPCLFLIFLVCQFSQHIPDTTVHVSHFSRFSGFLPYYKSWCVHFSFFLFLTLSQNISGPTMFLIFHVFQCFLAYSSSYV